jgi:hypothetical protein
MKKMIQICASQNDLFGLDADGEVHHYNFNTNSWMALGRGRQPSDGWAGSAEHGGGGRSEAGRENSTPDRPGARSGRPARGSA